MAMEVCEEAKILKLTIHVISYRARVIILYSDLSWSNYIFYSYFSYENTFIFGWWSKICFQLAKDTNRRSLQMSEGMGRS